MDAHEIFQDALKLLAVVVLVLLNAFFVAAGTGARPHSRDALDALVARGSRRAKTARHIVANIDAYIGATQFGITIVSLALGIAVEPVFHDLLEPVFKVLSISSETLQRNIASASAFL